MAPVMIPLRVGVFLDRAEFLVRHGHRPGQAHAGLIGGQNLGGDGAQRVAELEAGLHRVEVHHRPHFDHAAQVARRGRMALGQDAPGERRGLARQRRLDGFRSRVQQRRHGVQFEPAGVQAQQTVFETRDEAAQAHVGGHVLNERRAFLQPVKRAAQNLQRQEQQAVAGEKREAGDIGRLKEMRLVLGQAPGQFGGGASESVPASAPRPPRRCIWKRWKLFSNAVSRWRQGRSADRRALMSECDLEMQRRIAAGEHTGEQKKRHDDAGVADTEIDKSDDGGCQHSALTLVQPARKIKFLLVAFSIRQPPRREQARLAAQRMAAAGAGEGQAPAPLDPECAGRAAPTRAPQAEPAVHELR